jgi:spore coat protein A
MARDLTRVTDVSGCAGEYGFSGWKVPRYFRPFLGHFGAEPQGNAWFEPEALLSSRNVIGRRQLLIAALLAPWACKGGTRSRELSRRIRHPHTSLPPRASPSHPASLARFVDELPIPQVLMPDGTRPDPLVAGAELPFYRIAMRQTEVSLHRDLPPTRVWSYAGSVPGPTIEARSGQAILIEWRNELPEKHFLPVDRTLCGKDQNLPEVRAVVHVHGARTPAQSDGYPSDWYSPGHSFISHYPNHQDAATLWYHDHALGISRLNQYAGLFGLFLIRDEAEAALDLPQGIHEVPLLLCDRQLDERGQLLYPTSGFPDAPWVPEVYGDAHLVNGKLFPFLEVEPCRYRLRLLNASNSRFYYLSLSGGQRFYVIGSDQGLLTEPVAVTSLTLAPAERADVVVDFSEIAGEKVVLQSQAFELIQFRVAAKARAKRGSWPKKLRPVTRLSPSLSVKTRTLTLNEYLDPKTKMKLMLLNAARFVQPVTEKPVLDSVEIWSLVNLTEDTHPIHLHLVRFQLLDRQKFDADEYLTSGKLHLQGPPLLPKPEEAGWKDTIRAETGTVTRIIARFEGYAGRYVWHCHVLEHGDNEMMRPFEVTARRKT